MKRSTNQVTKIIGSIFAVSIGFMLLMGSSVRSNAADHTISVDTDASTLSDMGPNDVLTVDASGQTVILTMDAPLSIKRITTTLNTCFSPLFKILPIDSLS